jgi:hypothetical protein
MSDYNGWSNRETWLVNLWMDQSHASYAGIAKQYLVRELNDDGGYDVSTAARKAIFPFADYLQNWHEEVSYTDVLEGDYHASVFADLLSTALANVIWNEIAEAWLDEAAEEYVQELINNA